MCTIVGESAWSRAIRRQILQVATYPTSVLVSGPSGTGKELIARAIHAASGRHAAAFVPVDCASVPGELFAGHLFGHVLGAFTGANYARLGCFRAADGGTIFLDEIGELSLELQARLLRTLQERVVVPVGSEQGVPVDVRVVAATNRDLAAEVAAGRFRLDLYHRLNVVALGTVALRQRIEDIPAIAGNYLARLSMERGFPRKVLSSEALQALCEYDWPGNVRELQNALERAVVFTSGESIRTDFLPGRVVDRLPEPGVGSGVSHVQVYESMAAPRVWATLAVVECEHIRRTLERTNFNRSAAARLLKIDRASLARKIRHFHLDVPEARPGRPRDSALKMPE